MTEHRFELVGGHPALDFLNTVSDWTASEPRDYLPDFAEALRFAVAAGVVTAGEAHRLSSLAAGTELRKLRDLRARLERIVRALIASRSPAADDLDALARDAADAARTVRFRAARPRLARVIDADAPGVATMRLRIVEAAVALLTSDEMQRVSACPSCGWFFLDTTKNRSRRWCSMGMCGSSAKARAYYWRNRDRAGARRGA